MARRARTSKPKPDFHRQTVLFEWALAKFGLTELKEFSDRFDLKPETTEATLRRGGEEEGNQSVFLTKILNLLPATTGEIIGPDALREYDQRILEHTQAINSARAQHNLPKVDWKYFQYLALLFTEMFLDRYFTDPGALRGELNATIGAHNEAIGGPESPDFVAPFPTEPTAQDTADPREQLSRLAFWCATGSGKTLLMHVHIRQFRQYHAGAHKAGLWPKLDQIILVTPNDGLSTQHATELAQSGFDAVSIEEAGVDGLFAAHAQQAIKILSIHKFREDHGNGVHVFVVIEKPRLQRLIAVTRDDRRPREQWNAAPYFRIEANEQQTLRLSGRHVEVTVPATVHEPGVLFLKVTLFRRMLRALPNPGFLSIQANADGVVFGDVRLPLDSLEALLYPDADTAPERHPADRDDGPEQIPRHSENLFDP